MVFFPILIVLPLTLAWAHKELMQHRLGSKPTATHASIIDAVIRHCQSEGEHGVLLDLGSGYGDLVLKAAKALPGWRVMGVEASPVVWAISQIRLTYSNQRNAHFFYGNLADTWPDDMYIPTVVFNGLPASQVKLAAPNILSFLKLERKNIMHWLLSPALPLKKFKSARQEVLGKPGEEASDKTPKNRILYFYNTQSVPEDMRVDLEEATREAREREQQQAEAAIAAGIDPNAAMSPEDDYARQEAEWRAAQEAPTIETTQANETIAPQQESMSTTDSVSPAPHDTQSDENSISGSEEIKPETPYNPYQDR